ncbi:hypothetical protein G6F31_021316 [Rhizopus arrhizus]|nr:hypothetical protein G6F31_021316 [Rhizopus arrhizus]
MLTAASSACTGRTEVQAGPVMVGNKLGGDVSVTSGLLYIDGVLGGNAAISGGGMLFNGGRITGNATLAGGRQPGQRVSGPRARPGLGFVRCGRQSDIGWHIERDR